MMKSFGKILFSPKNYVIVIRFKISLGHKYKANNSYFYPNDTKGWRGSAVSFILNTQKQRNKGFKSLRHITYLWHSFFS